MWYNSLFAFEIIDNDSKSIDDLKTFNSDRYEYDESLSTENRLVFTR